MLKEENLPVVVTCPIVIQEVLQGIKDDHTHSKIRTSMTSFPCLDVNIPLERFIQAAALYRLARKKGLTIRSSSDCLIAAIAIHHAVPVMHIDRDFDILSKISALEILKKF